MCLTIFGITICISREQALEPAAGWRPGKEGHKAEEWLEEARQKGLLLTLLQGRR